MTCRSPNLGACRPGVVGATADLGALVRLYRKVNRPGSLQERAFFESMPSLALAIHHAAFAQDWRDKRFAHQRRIKKAALSRAFRRLQSSEAELRSCRSFRELHDLLDEKLGPLPGIGELYVYDTALRLGAFLGLHPREVYLHAGTRAGARAAGLSVRHRKTIPMDELPAPLRALSAEDVEDFLCIYKGSIQRGDQDQPRPGTRTRLGA